MSELRVFENDKTIYLFTSLTAGSSHIITATSRIETILKANKIPFTYKDTATDELAKKLFQRRASGKKLPLIVKEGYVLGGIEEIEEWNEYDEIREALGVTAAFTPFPAKPSAPTSTAASSSTTPVKKEDATRASAEQNLAIRQLGAEAAKVAASKKQVPTKISTTNPLLAEKTNTPTSATPAKSPASASILSPRSIPLPQTPTPASSTAKGGKSEPAKTQPSIPKLSGLQKPVHSPPSLHVDAANPALSAGPIFETQKARGSSSASDGNAQKGLKGAKVGEASKEEIKKVEQATAIQEESSEEDEDEESDDEEDSSEEEEDGDEEEIAKPKGAKEESSEEESSEEDSDEEEPPRVDSSKVGDSKVKTSQEESSDEESSEEESSEEESSEEENAEEKVVKAKEAIKTQDQDPKDASKASASVKD
ncbi:Nn.00g056150.m01.CDS01 [Neocucurbitaria sp. VM-36]